MPGSTFTATPPSPHVPASQIDLFMALFNPVECRTFLDENDRPRPTVIRVNTLKTTRRALTAALAARGVTMEPVGAWNPVAMKVFETSVPIGATPEYLAGHYMLQMAASMVPVIALEPQPVRPSSSRVHCGVCARLRRGVSRHRLQGTCPARHRRREMGLCVRDITRLPSLSWGSLLHCGVLRYRRGHRVVHHRGVAARVGRRVAVELAGNCRAPAPATPVRRRKARPRRRRSRSALFLAVDALSSPFQGNGILGKPWRRHHLASPHERVGGGPRFFVLTRAHALPCPCRESEYWTWRRRRVARRRTLRN